jgi:hypothetical protein
LFVSPGPDLDLDAEIAALFLSESRRKHEPFLMGSGMRLAEPGFVIAAVAYGRIAFVMSNGAYNMAV